MERTGTVVSTEKFGHEVAVVIHGLTGVREGQQLRLGEKVWTVVRKKWVRKPNIALVLNPAKGSRELPKVDDALELIPDPEEGENVARPVDDLTVETIVEFSKATLVCARGVLRVESGDVVTDGSGQWKVLDVSTGTPAAQGRTWLSLKPHGGTAFSPRPNARLLRQD